MFLHPTPTIYRGVTPQIAAAAKAAADFAAVNHTKDIQAQQVRTNNKNMEMII